MVSGEKQQAMLLTFTELSVKMLEKFFSLIFPLISGGKRCSSRFFMASGASFGLRAPNGLCKVFLVVKSASMRHDGSLAQLVERHVYTVDVIGSIPVGPTNETSVLSVSYLQ